MQNLFFESFIHNILTEGFSYVEYLNLHKHKCYFKKENDIIYFILPILLQNFSSEQSQELIELIKNYEKFFESNINKFNCNKILFLRLFISNVYEKDFLNKIENKFDINSNVLHIDWFIDLENKNIFSRKNHITKILNLQEIIKKSFNFNNKNDTFDTFTSEKHTNKNYYEFEKVPGNLTISLILVNFIIYFYINLFNRYDLYFWIRDLATTPEIFYKFEIYRLFTYMFLHFDFKHLLANCLSLYIFGSLVEKYIGKIKFLVYYFLGGILAGVASAMFTKGLSIGASGAIFAIEGALLHYFLKEKRNLGQFNFYSVFIILIIGIAMGFLQPNIDNAGHISGFLTGFILSFISYKFSIKK